MAIDTIFLCFCEDSERNDGITLPYYMSKGLMVRSFQLSIEKKSITFEIFQEFVENSSKALEALKKRQEHADAKKIKHNQIEPQPNPGIPQQQNPGLPQVA